MKNEDIKTIEEELSAMIREEFGDDVEYELQK